MSINFSELRELLGAIAATDITELALKTDEFELVVRQGQAAIAVETPTLLATPAVIPTVIKTAEETLAPIIAPTPPPTSAVPTPADKKWLAVTSPMVGTFYSAPAPEEPAFVEVGDSIRQGQTVCIIEAMKLMNEIESEVSGQVMEIAVANGESVEYGQTLLWVKA
ncbi:MAG: acetyl-CoA carboxylase biotin carboxyl carrier protein [Microcystaceae cyanobacterium]